MEDVIRISSGERGHDALMYPGDIDSRPRENGVAQEAPAAKV